MHLVGKLIARVVCRIARRVVQLEAEANVRPGELGLHLGARGDGHAEALVAADVDDASLVPRPVVGDHVVERALPNAWRQRRRRGCVSWYLRRGGHVRPDYYRDICSENSLKTSFERPFFSILKFAAVKVRRGLAAAQNNILPSRIRRLLTSVY